MNKKPNEEELVILISACESVLDHLRNPANVSAIFGTLYTEEGSIRSNAGVVHSIMKPKKKKKKVLESDNTNNS